MHDTATVTTQKARLWLRLLFDKQLCTALDKLQAHCIVMAEKERVARAVFSAVRSRNADELRTLIKDKSTLEYRDEVSNLTTPNASTTATEQLMVPPMLPRMYVLCAVCATRHRLCALRNRRKSGRH